MCPDFYLPTADETSLASFGTWPDAGFMADGECWMLNTSDSPSVEDGYLRGEGFDASEDGTGRGTPLVAFSSKDHGADAGKLAPTLRAMGHAASHANGGGLAYALTAPNGGGRGQERNIATRHGVRRLTPRECERLQGWPDDHTRYAADGREIADGPRYRMIGNGVAAPCAEWIARRLPTA